MATGGETFAGLQEFGQLSITLGRISRSTGIIYVGTVPDTPGVNTYARVAIDMLPATLFNPILVLEYGIDYHNGSTWVQMARGEMIGGSTKATLTPTIGLPIPVTGGNSQAKGANVRGWFRQSLSLSIGATFGVF